jgi:hypothetical protein
MIRSDYESTVQRESNVLPGVTYQIDRMSFGRRIELMKHIREATTLYDFNQAAEKPNQMAQAILSAEVDRLYLRWGLKEIGGILIDGVPATPELLMLSGPESLVQEALAFVRIETGLNEEEKKT